MSLYPSLEDLKLDEFVKVRINYDFNLIICLKTKIGIMHVENLFI